MGSFEMIMQRCLTRVRADVDKRPGSIIYDAIAPAVAELVQLMITQSVMMDRAFPDTAIGRDLTLLASERGVLRHTATQARRLGVFRNSEGVLMDVPLGIRFSGGDANYRVAERISLGIFMLTAEETGEIGNNYFGNLLPIDFVQGLGSAVLDEVLIPGEDEESDAALRTRYYASLDGEAYGGNIQDYKEKTEALDGVGAVKVIPVWNGGGTVKLIIIDSSWHVPSQTLVDSVQTAMDPVPNHGEGVGIAPIGHVVTVVGVVPATIDVALTVELQDEYMWDDVRPGIEEVITAYFTELAATWAGEEALTVRASQIEIRVLNVAGIVDVTKTLLNGAEANVSLQPEEIPLLGTVTQV